MESIHMGVSGFLSFGMPQDILKRGANSYNPVIGSSSKYIFWSSGPQTSSVPTLGQNTLMHTVSFEQTIHLVFLYYPGRELNFAVDSCSNLKGNLHTNGLQIQERNVFIHFLVGAHAGIVDLAFQI